MSETTVIYDPVGEVRERSFPLAPRLEELNGKTLGLFDNSKPNFDVFLARVEELLTQSYIFPQVVRQSKDTVKAAAPHSLLQELAEADLVINGMGD